MVASKENVQNPVAFQQYHRDNGIMVNESQLE